MFSLHPIQVSPEGRQHTQDYPVHRYQLSQDTPEDILGSQVTQDLIPNSQDILEVIPNSQEDIRGATLSNPE